VGGLQCGKDEWWEQSMVTDSSESVSNYLDSSQQLPPKPPDLHTAIIDTSTTGHFLAFQHQVRMLDQPQCPYTVTCQQEPQWRRHM
jgi:hypothetical protein